jgi:tetratricopeptide (TPR) repeat protein
MRANVWLEQLCAVNAFCIEFSSSDLRRAEEHLKRARALAEVTGSLEPIIANNTGHLQLQLGKFGQAETTLKRIADQSAGEVLQSTLDGLARLYLALGRLDDCEHALDSLTELAKKADLAPSFPFRSSLITRIRLLLRQAKWPEATKIASIAINEARSVAESIVLTTALC